MLDQPNGLFGHVTDVWLPEIDGFETLADGVGLNFSVVDPKFLAPTFKRRSDKTTVTKAGLYRLGRDLKLDSLIEALKLRAFTQAQLVKAVIALPAKFVPAGQAVFVPIIVDGQWHLTKLVRRANSIQCDVTLEDETQSFKAYDRLLFLFLATA